MRLGGERCFSWLVSLVDVFNLTQTAVEISDVVHVLCLCPGEMISQRTLPSTIMPLCLDILYKISDSERDLIRVIVDVVTELRVGPSDVSLVDFCLFHSLSLTARRVEQERDQDDTMSVADSIRYQRRNSVATTTDVAESPQDAMMAVLIDSRCLAICISLLERVNGVSFS